MKYSTDLRKRLLDFINNDGSKAAAERTFGVSRRTIYNDLEADESGLSNAEVRRYAYAPKGISVSDKILGSHRYVSTSLIAVRIGDSLTLPLLFQDTCDTLAFKAWLEYQLCPLLDETHVVILDNASFIKVQGQQR